MKYEVEHEVNLPGESKPRVIKTVHDVAVEEDAITLAKEEIKSAIENPLSIKVKKYKEPAPKEAKATAPAAGGNK